MYNVYKYLNSKPNPIKVNLEQSLFLNLHDIADICIPHYVNHKEMHLVQSNSKEKYSYKRYIIFVSMAVF